MKQITHALAIAVGILVSTSVFATGSSSPTTISGYVDTSAIWYVGAGVGESKFQADSVPDATIDDTDTGWKIFGGFQFNRNFAVEAGYVDLGRATATSTFGANSEIDKLEATGPFIDVLGILPLSNNFSIYGKVGGIYAKLTDSIGGTGAFITDSGSDSETKLKAKTGLGVQFNFTSNFAVRGEWERYWSLEAPGGDTGDIDLFSINAVFSFR